MGQEKVLALLHLAISSIMLGVMCDVSELRLAADYSSEEQAEGATKSNPDLIHQRNPEPTTPGSDLVSGVVGELPADPKDEFRGYDTRGSQSNGVETIYNENGYVYEKPEVPFEPGPPSKPEVPLEPVPPSKPEVPCEPGLPFKPEVPCEPGPPFKPEIPFEPSPPSRPEIPFEPVPPSKPEIPFEPVPPSKPEEPTGGFEGYHYPKPQNPMTYPPPTTDQTFPEASARSILVK